LRGEIPAVLSFWHYVARLKARGMTELLAISDVLRELGIDQPLPLLGWVFKEGWAAEKPAAIVGLLRASFAAKRVLADSDSEWERIRPLTKAEDDEMLVAIRDAFREGIPKQFGAAERQAAERVFAILAREGGAELVGSSDALQPGTFWAGFQISQ